MRIKMSRLSLFTFLFCSLSSTVFAQDTLLHSLHRNVWNISPGNDLEVVWIEDQKFPKFTASVYFKDGALSDKISGVTEATFDLLTSGTKNETQEKLAEFFDFYGARLSHNVTHEYSVFTVQALTKDLGPVVTKVCELFNSALYPENELSSYIARSSSQLKNLVTSHSELAERALRRVIFKGTPYELPAEGILSSLKDINTRILKERLLELNKTKKVLYLTGPSEVNHIQEVIRQSCKWSGEREAQLSQLKDSGRKNVIHFVPMPKANQAQIKIGRFISSKDFSGHFDEYSFLSGFLGGGFTSKLVQELRVKRGLTYSAGSYVSMQREYGRAGISTFSKNETTLQTLEVIKDVLKNFSQHKITSDEFNYHKNRQIGGFAFGFEETTSLLFQIMLLDHQKRNSLDLLNFPKKLESLTLEDFLRNTDDIFVWDNLDILIVGDPSLIKILSKLRRVEILKIKDFL